MDILNRVKNLEYKNESNVFDYKLIKHSFGKIVCNGTITKQITFEGTPNSLCTIVVNSSCASGSTIVVKLNNIELCNEAFQNTKTIYEYIKQTNTLDIKITCASDFELSVLLLGNVKRLPYNLFDKLIVYNNQNLLYYKTSYGEYLDNIALSSSAIALSYNLTNISNICDFNYLLNKSTNLSIKALLCLHKTTDTTLTITNYANNIDINNIVIDTNYTDSAIIPYNTTDIDYVVVIAKTNEITLNSYLSNELVNSKSILFNAPNKIKSVITPMQAVGQYYIPSFCYADISNNWYIVFAPTFDIANGLNIQNEIKLGNAQMCKTYIYNQKLYVVLTNDNSVVIKQFDLYSSNEIYAVKNAISNDYYCSDIFLVGQNKYVLSNGMIHLLNE